MGLIGRHAELAVLRERLSAARRGRPAMVFVAGEPGVGKTRLATEVADLAHARSFHVAWGHCRETEGAPAYWPWTQALRTALRHVPDEDVPAEAAEVRPLLDLSTALTGTDRFRLFDAVGRVLEQIAQRRPLLLVFDDLPLNAWAAATATPSVSVIRKHSAAVWIEDLGSTGGTWVNEQRVAAARALRHGDHVRFGAVLARFEDRAAAMERDDATEMAKPDGHPQPPVLSPRQHQILAYLREGWTNPEIARQLEVTERTVKAHCQELFDRLGTHNRTGAVVTAMQCGLLDPAPTGS